MKKFDLFVIGAGVAGINIARKAAKNGLSVGITDKSQYGGTCALRGCDPKKVLIGPTEVSYHASHLAGKGISQQPEINWVDLMHFKSDIIADMPSQIKAGFKKQRIDMYDGSASFLSKDTFLVGEKEVKADKIAIATGARPRKLDFPGAEYARTSSEFLQLQEMPESLLFIGGGYIGFEFAHIAARAGAEVTIVHRSEKPLKNFEQDIVNHLVRATKDLGINLVLETEVCGIKKINEGYKIKGNYNGEDRFFESDMVFNSAGRVPDISGLNLDRAGIESNRQGIVVNKYMQSTSNSRVYAAGDVASTDGLPLTPVSTLEGYIAADNIIEPESKEIEYPPMPSVVFTLPTMASVGLTVTRAEKEGYNYKVNYQDASGWFNANRQQVPEYAFKVIINKDTETILGAHLIGPNAEEIINLFTLYIKTGIKVNEIKKMIFTYPTLASDIKYML